MVAMIMCPSVDKLTQLIQLRADRHLSLKLRLMKSENFCSKNVWNVQTENGYGISTNYRNDKL